jgi:hypothetical protein
VVAPSRDERQGRAGQRVEQPVEHADRRLGAQARAQLVRGVLQAEHDQQQDHADVGGDLDEVAAGRQRQHTALPEAEPGEQVERDDRDVEPPGEAAQHTQTEQQRAEFDEQQPDLRRAARRHRSVRRLG